MCGICGYISRRDPGSRILSRMSSEIVYRGPDDGGSYCDSVSDYHIGFAHRRLSILDLSSNGHQPMLSDDGRIVIVFNGEVYNYREIRKELAGFGFQFRTGTDTEVIIKAYQHWGIRSVSRFNGMFAFALLDRTEGCVYLARDRIGVKPLYYYLHGNDLVFASELKPILVYPGFQREISRGALRFYLAAQYIPGERCIFQQTRKLLPGTILKWTSSGIETETYWSAEAAFSRPSGREMSYEDARDTLGSLLSDSVRLRMISDVPLGAFLSNGVDSSLVTAYMQKASSAPVKTFTVGFAEDGYDESGAARRVAAYLGTDHTDFILSHDEGRKLIPELPLYYDEPMADASQIAAMLVSGMAREKVTVALTGDAGDELFCGYGRYRRLRELRDKYMGISSALHKMHAGDALKGLRRAVNIRSLDKLLWMYDDESLIEADLLTYWDRYAGLISGGEPETRHAAREGPPGTIEEKAMLHDLLSYLPDDILTKVDRASMSVSLECRAPLLDHRIVAFALSLPLQYKYHDGVQKRILKDLLFREVPRELIGREKRGFAVPVEKWMREDLDGIRERFFRKEYIEKQGIFSYSVIRRILVGFESGRNPNYAKELWTLYAFQLWHARYLGDPC